jgi:hypothetical protein
MSELPSLDAARAIVMSAFKLGRGAPEIALIACRKRAGSPFRAVA